LYLEWKGYVGGAPCDFCSNAKVWWNGMFGLGFCDPLAERFVCGVLLVYLDILTHADEI
jgi:hypothetical protein